MLWSRSRGAYRAVNISDEPEGRPPEQFLNQVQMVNGIGHNLNLAGGLYGVNLMLHKLTDIGQSGNWHAWN